MEQILKTILTQCPLHPKWSVSIQTQLQFSAAKNN